MKKRICNFVCNITSGGVESVIQNYFAHMDCSDYDLDLVTYGVQSEPCAEKFKALGFHVITIPPKRAGFFRSLSAMSRVIKTGHYDVVHAHLTEWNCLPMWLAKKYHVPIRISHSHMAERNLSTAKKILLKIQRRIIVTTSTRLCACGEDAGRYLYGDTLFERGRVTVLNNAIESKKFAPNPEVRTIVRKELGIRESTLCIGHIGRFQAQKNHAFLVDIFNELLKLRPDSVLLMVGTGNLAEDMKLKCESLGIADKVQFLGVRADPERLYQAMDVFCLPSLFEGLPVVGIEVQAAQIPAVLSDRISEKVKLTNNVYFVSLEDGAEKWAKSLIDVAGKGKNCVFPKEYDIEEMCREWQKLYEF